MLKNRAIKGILWNFSEQLSRRGVSVLVTLFLARILLPSDFGLVAMMSIFLALGTTLMDAGFRQSLIRKLNFTQLDGSTVFYTNILLGLVSYILLFLVAPFVSRFYEESQLISLIRVSSVSILINSLQPVQLALLSRNLNFRAQMRASVPASIVSGFVAVFLAFSGWGVWSLVVQMLLSSAITAIIIWRMRLWTPTFEYSISSFKEMFGFSFFIFIDNVFNTIHSNLYVAVVAKLFSSGVAGQYFFAERIKDMLISQFVNSIKTVTYPALATMGDNDERLKSGYRKVIQVSCFILFPVLIFFAVFSEIIFSLLLSSKWLPAVPYFQLMCLIGLMYPLNNINLNIMKIKGRSNLIFYIGVFKKISAVLLLLVSYRYGVIGILLGQCINSVLGYVPNVYYSSRLIGYNVSEQLSDFVGVIFVCAIIGLVAYILINTLQFSDIFKLLCIGPLSLFVYIASAHILKIPGYIVMLGIVKQKLIKL